MQKLKLLTILPSYSSGGAEKVILSLLNALDENEQNIISKLLVINSKGPLKKKSKNIDKIELYFSRLFYALPKIVSLINKLKISVVLSTFPHISLPLIVFNKLRIINIALIVREPNILSMSLNQSLKLKTLRFFYHLIIPFCDKLVVTSEAMKQEIKKIGITKNKVFLIRNPVNIKNIRNKVIVKRTKGNGLRLVFASRLVFQKGLDRFLPILKNLDNTKLTVIGGGPELFKLRKLRHQLNIKKKVKFIGYLDNPHHYIAGADYLILPSRWEGLPNIALESLALGTPVLAFEDIEALKDYRKSLINQNIILCRNEDVMREFIEKTKTRKDYLNPVLRKSLLELNNTPLEYSLKIGKLIKEAFDEKKY